MAADERSVRVHIEHLLRERAIGSGISRRGHDDRQAEQLAKLGVGHHILLVESGIPVSSKLVETDLEVEDEQEL